MPSARSMHSSRNGPRLLPRLLTRTPAARMRLVRTAMAKCGGGGHSVQRGCAESAATDRQVRVDALRVL
jgi:hypothetical protein